MTDSFASVRVRSPAFASVRVRSPAFACVRQTPPTFPANAFVTPPTATGIVFAAALDTIFSHSYNTGSQLSGTGGTGVPSVGSEGVTPVAGFSNERIRIRMESYDHEVLDRTGDADRHVQAR